MTRAVLLTFPSHFLAFFSQTDHIIEQPEPLISDDGPRCLIYARFPYASIIGECNPSFLEQKTKEEFHAFLHDQEQFTLYRKTLDYPSVQNILPEYDPLRDRYYLLSDHQYAQIQKTCAGQYRL